MARDYEQIVREINKGGKNVEIGARLGLTERQIVDLRVRLKARGWPIVPGKRGRPRTVPSPSPEFLASVVNR